MTSGKRSRVGTVVLLGAAALFPASADVLAEPPPKSVATADPTSDAPASSVPDPPGQTVTLTGPFESPKPKKRSKPATQVVKPAEVTPSRSASVPPATASRRSTSTSQDGAVRAVPKSRQSVRGGFAVRVAVRPAARGGPSTEYVVARAAKSAAPPALPRAVVAAKPRDFTRWALPLLAAVAALEVLLGIRFAYRRWSRRRVLRLAARTAERAPAPPRAIVREGGSVEQRPTMKRWRP